MHKFVFAAQINITLEFSCVIWCLYKSLAFAFLLEMRFDDIYLGVYCMVVN